MGKTKTQITIKQKASKIVQEFTLFSDCLFFIYADIITERVQNRFYFFQDLSHTSIYLNQQNLLMEKIQRKIQNWKCIVLDRIFLIQDHNFDSRVFLVILFLLEFITGINSFMFCQIETNSSSNKFLQKYIKLTQQIEMLSQNILLYVNILISFAIMIYLLALSKASNRQSQNSGVRKASNQNLLVGIITNFTYVINALLIWLLNFAVFSILYSYNTSRNEYSIIIGLLGCLEFIFLVTFSCIYQILFVSLSFNNINMMLKYSTIKTFVVKLLHLIITIIIATGYFKGKVVQTAFSIFALISFSYKLYKDIFDLTFFNPFTKKLSQALSICNFFFSIVIVLQMLIPIDIIQDNLIIIFIICVAFSFTAVQSYRGHLSRSFSMAEISDLKSIYDARNYFEVLLSLLKDYSNETELIMMSLLKAHRISCENPDCYCLDRKLDNRQLSIKFSLQKWKLLEKEFTRNQQIMLMGKYFLYQCFGYYPQVITYLQQIAHKQADLQFVYMKYHLKISIIKQIQKSNNQKNLVESQGPINLETSLNTIMEKIKKVTYSFYKKYKYLSKGLCRITEIETASELQLKILKEIQVFYQENKQKYKRSAQFSFVLYFFFSRVFMLSIRINQIKRQLANLKDNILLSNDTQLATFKKAVFHNNCCAFQSSLSNKSLGIVNNASKNIMKLFGFDRNAIIGKNINKVLLPFLGQEHDRLLTQWYKTGSYSKLGVFISSFCLDHTNKIFGAKIYLKLNISINDEIRFIAMLKKKEDNSNLIILNDQQNVQGFGEKISSLTGFESQKCPGQLLFVDFETLEIENDTPKQINLYIRGFKGAQYMAYIQQIFDLKNKSANCKLDSTLIQNMFQSKIIVHLCKFLVSKNRLGTKSYLSLELINVQQNGYTKLSGSFRQNLDSIEGSNNINGKTFKQDQIIEQIACESVNSSQTNDNFFISKVMKTYFEFFINDKNIQSNRINITTYILLALVTLIAGKLIFVHNFYLVGLNSVYEVCFADGAVSDNMQLFEFLYGNSMLMKQYKNTTDLQIIHNSSKEMQNYVYGLLAYDMEYLFKSIVSLTKLPYYEYMRLPIEWRFPHEGIKLQSYQFLEYYYYLARQSWKKEPTQNYLNLFMINFPQMKRINHQNLEFYADQTMKVIFWLTFMFYLNILLLLILSIGIGIVLHHYYYTKYKQKIQCNKIYSFLCQQQIDQLKNYYGDIHEYIVNKTKEKNFNINTQDFSVPVTKGSKNMNTKLNIIVNKNYLSIFWIILVIVTLNVTNLVSNLETQKLFEPSSQMVLVMSQLMDSQNYLIQSYFQMKAHFLVGNQSKTINQMADELLQRIYYDQLLFNIIATDSLQLFKKYDPSYQKDFIDLLIDNICGIVDKNITDFQRWQCKYDLHEDLIDLGVVGGMNQFYRQVQSSLYMMKTIDMTNFDIDAYFKSTTVRQTDKNIFFMFKMYQITQQRIMLSLSNLIQDDFNNRFVWLVVEIATVLILVFFWVFYIPSQRAQISKLYGSFLLIPQGVVAQCKNLIRKTQDIMEG